MAHLFGRSSRRAEYEQTRAGRSAPGPHPSGLPVAVYWQIGVPSLVEPPPSVIEQVFEVPVLEAVAVQPVVVTADNVTVTPGDDA